MSNRKWVALAFSLPFFVGCASQEKVEEAPLPFHLAIVPLEPAEREDFELADMDGDPLEDVKLAFDPTATTTALIAELDGKRFTRATALQYPSSMTRETFLTKLPHEQADYWVQAAERIDADLVLLVDFEYSPVIWSNINNKFWLNLPLFLLGGPFCYFVDDRDYHSNVRLSTEFFDVLPLTLLRQASFDAGSEDARVTALPPKDLQKTDLNFWSRADLSPGWLALSLVCPAGLLAEEGRGVPTKLADEIVATLAKDLADEVRLRSDLLSQASNLYPFYVDLDTLTVVEASSGAELRGELVLELGGEITGMDSFAYQLTPDAPATKKSFDNGRPQDDRRKSTRRYEFFVPLGSVDWPAEVRVEFKDASGSASRSFTFNPRDYASRS